MATEGNICTKSTVVTDVTDEIITPSYIDIEYDADNIAEMDLNRTRVYGSGNWKHHTTDVVNFSALEIYKSGAPTIEVADLIDDAIDAAGIDSVVRSIAANLSGIQQVRFTITGDTGWTTDYYMINTNLTNYDSEISLGAETEEVEEKELIEDSAWANYLTYIKSYIDLSKEVTATYSLCHSSCHGNCHSSRSRR